MLTYIFNSSNRYYGLFSFSLLLPVLFVVVFEKSLYSSMLYTREDVGQGELWRLLTASFVHSNLNHALLNGLGLVVITALVKPVLSAAQLATSALAAISGVPIMLYLFSPDITWYVGLSGALHGILAAGGIVALFKRNRFVSLVFIIVSAKVLYEQTPLFDRMHLQNIIAVPVLPESHLYGFISGIFSAAFILLFFRCAVKKIDNDKM